MSVSVALNVPFLLESRSYISCFILQFVAMGYAEGKKIVIKERRYTMEIKSLTSMGEYKLDQIV